MTSSYDSWMAAQVPPPSAGRESPVSDAPDAEDWRWTLALTDHEAAVELWRNGDHRITIPLTADQAELLMGHPVSLYGVLKDGI